MAYLNRKQHRGKHNKITSCAFLWYRRSLLCACVPHSPWPCFFFASHAGSLLPSLLSVMAARVLQQCVRSLARPSLRLLSGNLAVRAAAGPAVAIHRPLSSAADSRRTRWLVQSRVSLVRPSGDLPTSFKTLRLTVTRPAGVYNGMQAAYSTRRENILLLNPARNH